MVYREHGMWEVLEVLRRAHRGEKVKAIVRSTGRSRNTVKRYLFAAGELDWRPGEGEPDENLGVLSAILREPGRNGGGARLPVRRRPGRAGVVARRRGAAQWRAHRRKMRGFAGSVRRVGRRFEARERLGVVPGHPCGGVEQDRLGVSLERDEVVEGLDVVKKIGTVATGSQDRPVKPVVMTHVTITRVA